MVYTVYSLRAASSNSSERSQKKTPRRFLAHFYPLILLFRNQCQHCAQPVIFHPNHLEGEYSCHLYFTPVNYGSSNRKLAPLFGFHIVKLTAVFHVTQVISLMYSMLHRSSLWCINVPSSLSGLIAIQWFSRISRSSWVSDKYVL